MPSSFIFGRRACRIGAGALLCGALTVAGGCSDAATVPAESAATAADRAVAAGQSAVSSATAVLEFSLPQAAVASAGASVPSATSALLQHSPVSKSIACPAGGTGFTTGSIAGTMPARGAFTLAISLSTTLTNCGVQSDGKTLILNTSTPLTVTGSYAVTDRTPAAQQTMRVQGTATMAISGSKAPAVPCPIDLTVTITSGTRAASVTGSFCGSTVTTQMTLR